MISDKLFGVCAALLLSGCVAPDAREPVYSPSELNTHPKLYEGREVRVRGWIVLRPENRNIWDAKSDFEQIADLSHCVSLIGVHDWTLDRRIDDQVLTISGVFHQYEHPEEPVLGMCNNSAIEVNTSKSPFRNSR